MCKTLRCTSIEIKLMQPLNQVEEKKSDSGEKPCEPELASKQRIAEVSEPVGLEVVTIALFIVDKD